MTPAPITLADTRQIGSLGGAAPRVAANGDLDPLLRRAYSHAIDRGGKKIVRNEFVKSLYALVRHIKENHSILKFGAPTNQFDRFQMLGIKIFKSLVDVRQGDDFLQGPG